MKGLISILSSRVESQSQCFTTAPPNTRQAHKSSPTKVAHSTMVSAHKKLDCTSNAGRRAGSADTVYGCDVGCVGTM
ncbi:hypothetical protein M3J09_000586 [Ascochyta lentis]